jgi:hypothetical protein
LGPLVVPGLVAVGLASAVYLIWNAVSDDDGDSVQPDVVNMKGERGKTAKPEGTDNPFKKMRPHPSDPSKVRMKDPHTGKFVDKPKPAGFDDWWNSR